MPYEISVEAIRVDTLRDGMKTIHPKKTLSFDDRLQVIVGSNGSGKSTFAKKLREKYGFDYYNSSESAPHRRLNGSMAYSEDVRFDMLSVMSSDGESQFQELAGFIGKSKSSTVILDEPEKGLSMNAQIGLCHMIIEELLKKKKRVILITHSYILASFGQKNGFPAYDFDTKKMSKDYVPKL